MEPSPSSESEWICQEKSERVGAGWGHACALTATSTWVRSPCTRRPQSLRDAYLLALLLLAQRAAQSTTERRLCTEQGRTI